MDIHIISLFPESMRTYLDTSMMKRAQEKGLFRYFLHNLTDWTVRNTRRVDDRPYGGGAGTIIMIEPLTHALRDIQEEYGLLPIYLMSPAGALLTQESLERYSAQNNLQEEGKSGCIIICGHYEGVDARIYDLFDIDEVSIGEYVLSSGELAALVFIDGMVRLIPGVLADDSREQDSFSKQFSRKKEYPQYSRPEIFEGKSVPGDLLSGDHAKIEAWKESHLR